MLIELEIDEQAIVDKITDMIAKEVVAAFGGERGAAFEDKRVVKTLKEEAIKMGRKCLEESKPYIVDRIIERSTKELSRKAYASVAEDLKKEIRKNG